MVTQALKAFKLKELEAFLLLVMRCLIPFNLKPQLYALTSFYIF
jgi:hypothetical protein